jgi:acyl-CoA synthetase (AMP-forming)/AMP-acid ligase II
MSRLRTLPEALGQAARADAGYCFVAEETDAYRTYADMYEASLRAARALREAGLRPGDLVGLILPDAEEFLVVLFGASIAGAIPASLYPPATSTGLSRYMELTSAILRTSGARAVVTTRALAPEFSAMRALCPELSLVLSGRTRRAGAGSVRCRRLTTSRAVHVRVTSSPEAC